MFVDILNKRKKEHYPKNFSNHKTVTELQKNTHKKFTNTFFHNLLRKIGNCFVFRYVSNKIILGQGKQDEATKKSNRGKSITNL